MKTVLDTESGSRGCGFLWQAAGQGVPTLARPVHRVVGPPGVKLGGRELRSEPTPLLLRTEAGRWCLRVTTRRGCVPVAAEDAAATKAVDALFRELDDPGHVQSVCLEAGDFLLVSNTLASHSRRPATRPGERLLFRTLVRGDLTKLGPPVQPDGRVFSVWNALALAS